MRQIRTWLLRLAGLFARGRRDRELTDELESHLQMQIAYNLGRGMSTDEARRRALIEAGGVESAKEQYRDRRGIPVLETLFQDLRFAARTLLKTPAFTLTAVVALGLGIGANTAVFSLVDGILLKPLGFRDPEKLVRVWEHGNGLDHAAIAYLNFKDWNDLNTSFDQLAAFRDTAFALQGREGPERIDGRQVSANFLSTLGVAPAAGRDFSPDDDKPGASLVAVISDALWARSFGRDPGTLGKSIILNDDSYVVIGILPRGFQFYTEAGVLVSLSAKPDPYFYIRGIHPGIQSIGRLKPAVSLAQANRDMAAIAGRLADQYPDTNQGLSTAIAPLYDDIVGDAGHLLSILLAAVALVLLIACANVANLMLARAATRQREIAIRSALGASKLRTAQMLMTESILLSLIGGGIGLLAAFWGTDAALGALPKVLPRSAEIGVDFRVLAFTISASLLTGLIFGLAPAVHAARMDLNQVLKEGGRSGGANKGRVRSALVITEMALALVLLVGAGLVVRSLANLYRVKPGFDANNVLSFRIDLSPRAYSEATKIRAFYRDFPARARNLPGVQVIGAASVAPLNGYTIDFPFYVSGRAAPRPSDMPLAMDYLALPGYLETMRIPLIQGRFIDDRDTDKTPAVAVIDETLARQYFPGEDPVAQRLTVQAGKDATFELEIIGVVGHVKQENLDTEAGSSVQPQIYTALNQLPDPLMVIAGRNMNWLVRTSSDPRNYVSAIRSELAAVAPNQLMFAIMPMQEAVSNSMSDRRFVLILLGVFSLAALVLASIGTYGLMSYSVAQRRNEMGIRMALGASRGRLLRRVLGDGMKLAGIGVGGGAIGAIMLTRFISGFLYGISPTDPVTFVGIALFLCGVALLASYIPARRATRVDPMVALRYE
jgi:predicted permease